MRFYLVHRDSGKALKIGNIVMGCLNYSPNSDAYFKTAWEIAKEANMLSGRDKQRDFELVPVRGGY